MTQKPQFFPNASNSRIVKMEAEEINTALKVAEVEDAIIGFSYF